MHSPTGKEQQEVHALPTKGEAMTRGLHDSGVIMKIDLRQKRGQRLAENGPVGIEVSTKQLTLCV